MFATTTLLWCLFITCFHMLSLSCLNKVYLVSSWNLFAMCFFQDCFFYSLVFDPVQKTLLADQGEIRVGSKYQAEIPDKLAEGELETLEKQMFPEFNELFPSLSLNKAETVRSSHSSSLSQVNQTTGSRRSWRPRCGTPTTSSKTLRSTSSWW